MNTMDLEGKKMLIRPNIAESANKNNFVIGEPRKSKEGDKILRRQVVLDKQPGGKEIIKITIKNHTLAGQPQVQENTHAKFVKPKSPEVGKWKTNEAKVHCKKIKPTFDMLLSKYVNQASGSSSNWSSNLKRSRSLPMDGANPLCTILHGRLQCRMEQPPMAPYAFHPGRAEPRRPIHERLSYPTRGCLKNGVKRPMQNNQKRVSMQVWHAK